MFSPIECAFTVGDPLKITQNLAPPAGEEEEVQERTLGAHLRSGHNSMFPYGKTDTTQTDMKTRVEQRDGLLLSAATKILREYVCMWRTYWGGWISTVQTQYTMLGSVDKVGVAGSWGSPWCRMNERDKFFLRTLLPSGLLSCAHEWRIKEHIAFFGVGMHSKIQWND